MMPLKLSIATTDYDHFRDFRTGTVRAEGIDHTWSMLSHHEVFARFTANREWDVAELSFAKFSAQVTRDDCDIVGLPVVCSRLFRFSSFYVNRNAGTQNRVVLCRVNFRPSIPRRTVFRSAAYFQTWPSRCITARWFGLLPAPTGRMGGRRMNCRRATTWIPR